MPFYRFSAFRFNLRRRQPRQIVYGMLLSACALIAVPSALAQYDTATVVGTVSDPKGAAVTNADVTLRNVDLGTLLTRKTDSRGSYEFPDVQIGTYTVTVEATGFTKSVTAPFELSVAEHQRIDVPLNVGAVQETVTVALANLGLQTQTGDQSTIISNEEIVDLPLNGRDYTDLALLVPGVQAGALEDGTVQQRRGSFVVNGNRSSVNNFLLDGLDNNSYQVANQGYNNQAVAESVDAIQEYKVITSNFPAEYGRAGGAVVTVTTKTGTDRLHGTLYEYVRNTVFDAYGPFWGIGVNTYRTGVKRCLCSSYILHQFHSDSGTPQKPNHRNKLSDRHDSYLHHYTVCRRRTGSAAAAHEYQFRKQFYL